mgnify:CR=1 FL=1
MPEIRERNGDPISRLWTQTLNRSYFCVETRKTIKACRKDCENKLKGEGRKQMKRQRPNANQGLTVAEESGIIKDIENISATGCNKFKQGFTERNL